MIYVAGPMTGYDLWNFPAFFAAERDLKSQGYEVVNPAREDVESGRVHVDWDNDVDIYNLERVTKVELTEDFSWRDTIEKDLELIDGCDWIYMLTGWENSLGARIERDHAIANGKHVLYQDEVLYEAKVMKANLAEKVEELIGYSGDGTVPVYESDEVRMVNETTGGEKGQKLARFDLLPAEALTKVAEHYGIGARKYSPWNWRRGYEFSLSMAALQRHYMAFAGGEDLDPETGSPHMAAVVFHALALLTFADEHPELDDRYKAEP